MKDRIPTYPGRVKLTPVTGSPDLFDMEMADEPTQVGTPLNKATFLTDETEVAIWGDVADRTVDNALQALKKSTINGAIGDIRVSAVDLEAESGGKWLVCDGRELSVSGYSKLSQVLGYYKNLVFEETSNEKYKITNYSIASNITSAEVSPKGVLAVAYNSSGATSNYARKIYITLSNGTTNRAVTSTYYYVTLFFVDEELFMIGKSSSASGLCSLYSIDYTKSTPTVTKIADDIRGTSGIYGYYKKDTNLCIVTKGYNATDSSVYGYHVINLDLESKSATVEAFGGLSVNLDDPIVIGSRIYYLKGSTQAYYDLNSKKTVSVPTTNWPVTPGAKYRSHSQNFAYSVLQETNCIVVVNNDTLEVNKYAVQYKIGNSVYNYTIVSKADANSINSETKMYPELIISNEGELDIYFLTQMSYQTDVDRVMLKPVKIGNSYIVSRNTSGTTYFNATTFYSYVKIAYQSDFAFPLCFRTNSDDTNVKFIGYRNGILPSKFKLPLAVSRLFTPNLNNRDLYIRAKE